MLIPFDYPNSVNQEAVKKAFDSTQEIEGSLKFSQTRIPIENVLVLEEGKNRGLEYVFGLKELFELVKAGAQNKQFSIEAGPFVEKFLNPIAANDAQEKEKTDSLSVKIDKIEVGALSWNIEEEIALAEHGNKTLTFYVSTNAISFDEIGIQQLFEQGRASLSSNSIPSYEPNKSYPINLNIPLNQLEITESKIVFSAYVYTTDAKYIYSKSTIKLKIKE
ncbi:MAG: hypothetical protein HYW50_01740 [Candidatus Diapherotrites archaeon]|nr:hypothetical protein [Candidatus Diapherotrites archaeon]